jgi:outer membrane protein OmpA-like peptidoglycan-associated protein
MSFRAIAIGAAMLVWAVPAFAQTRGTVELGGFASAGSFDNSLGLKNGFGGGARIGAFLDPRWSIEAEAGEMKATRPNGLADVNVGILSTRLVAVPIKAGALSIHLGVGAGVGTETWFLHSYGVNAMVGAKIALGKEAALRIDAQQDWLANYSYKAYQRVSVGLSFYRELFRTVRTDTVRVPGPAASCERCVQRADSVSAAETRRLRDRDAALRALRDSLSRVPASPPPVSSADARASMEERIQFAFDKSDVTDASRAILDEKVAVFRANPTMTILIAGNTDPIGTDSYNMALGMRRAAAAKAYIVSRGIDASRVQIESKGESDPVVSPPVAGKAANAPNRRDMFRLIIVPDVVKKP